MGHYNQIIDANLSRCAEGLRVIEDLCRFELSNTPLTKKTKTYRNTLKKIATTHFTTLQCVASRSVTTDQRANDTLTKRKNTSDLFTANIKRCTEACRVLEECTGIQDFSTLRYNIYNLEQDIQHAIQRTPLTGPGIYVVSDNPDHLIECSNKAYVPIVQYRNKTASKSDIYNTCKQLSKDIQANNTLFIVNDFVDIAKSCHADGVHIGQDDIPIEHIRSILGETLLIGKTTHTLEQGLKAQAEGADYVSIGPIWDTPSKPNRPGIGFDYLNATSQLHIPFVAIGGINTENMHQLLDYTPPLIGAIRATQNIDKLWQEIQKSKSTV